MIGEFQSLNINGLYKLVYNVESYQYWTRVNFGRHNVCLPCKVLMNKHRLITMQVARTVRAEGSGEVDFEPFGVHPYHFPSLRLPLGVAPLQDNWLFNVATECDQRAHAGIPSHIIVMTPSTVRHISLSEYPLLKLCF